MVTSVILQAGLMLATIIVPALSCPANITCICQYSHVNCENLTFLPTDLPEDTSSLTIQHSTFTTITNDSLTNLSFLTVLRIIHNSVSEIEAGAFDKLGLFHLSLRSNKISSLQPGTFSSHHKLTELILTDNRLESLEGLFDGLSALQILQVDRNRISQLTPNTFKGLKMLTRLNLHENRITTIPEDTFNGNKFLSYLSLGSNPLGEVGPILTKHRDLHYINLTDCALTQFPGNLPKSLLIIRLSKNNITKVHKKDLQGYQELTSLILDENKLSYIEEGSLSQLKHLKELYLYVNDLDVMPGPFPNSVEQLYLDNNRISSLPAGTFTEGTSLTLLSLKYNKISAIDNNAFSPLLSLHNLHLEANAITVLTNAMFGSVNLTRLSLNRLHLKSIEKDCFAGQHALKTLEMAYVNVKLEDIEGNFFQHSPDLHTLDVHNSPSLARFIVYYPYVMANLGKLQELNLMETGLTKLASEFQYFFSSLTKLNLAGNHFHCNSDIAWLKSWYDLTPEIFVQSEQVPCHQPHHIKGQQLFQLEEYQFHVNYTDTDSSTDYTPAHDYDVTTIHDQSYIDSTTEFDYSQLYEDAFNQSNVKTPYDTTLSTPTTIYTTTGRPPYTVTTQSTTGTTTTTTSSSLRHAGIAIGMAVAVIVIMLLIAACVYAIWKWRRERHLSHDYQGKEDYVFIVSKTETTEPSPNPRPSRDQRGSTTSRASEDITNQTDFSVYTLDVDE